MGIKFKLAPAKKLSGIAQTIVDVLVGGCEDAESQQAISAKAEETFQDNETAKVLEARTLAADRLGITDTGAEAIDQAVKNLQKATTKAKAMRLAMLAQVNGATPIEQARKMMNTAIAGDVLNELARAMSVLKEDPRSYLCERSTRTKSGYGKAAAAPGYVLAWWDLKQTIEICKKAAQAPQTQAAAKAA